MNTTLTKLSAIKRNPNNPRVLQDEKLVKLVKSIKDFPQMLEIRPIVVNDDMVVLGGNMRLKACKEAGLTEVPVIKASDLTEDQQREFIIKDNVGFGEWDWELLQDEWDTDLLDEWGLDLEFETIDEDNDGLTDEDEIPELEEEHISKLGDVWILGNHRLMCGDSTKSEDVGLLMNGIKADMVFTDPPWNVNYGAVQAGNAQGYKPRTILNDFMGTEDFKDFMDSTFAQLNEHSNKGCPTYVVMSAQEWGNMMLTLAMNEYHWSSTIIWNKSSLVLSRKDYHTKYEPIWYGWLEGEARLCPLEDRKQSDVWDIDRPSRSELHPTTKPVELVERAIKNSSKKDDYVLDLFGGSGTTLIAAEKSNRKNMSMELDPKYVDVIIKRWQEYTGKDAINAETGEEFYLTKLNEL
jgi:DNA modification methylase